jgi:class 3 adenylate cyclase
LGESAECGGDLTVLEGIDANTGVADDQDFPVEVQRAERERNSSLPIERRTEFPIGINLGDVIVEGDDIHGDGVIIAERLQQLADKGGTVISGTGYDQVKGKVAVGFAFLGESASSSDLWTHAYTHHAILRTIHTLNMPRRHRTVPSTHPLLLAFKGTP